MASDRPPVDDTLDTPPDLPQTASSEPPGGEDGEGRIGRRGFLRGLGGSLAATAIGAGGLLATRAEAETEAGDTAAAGPGTAGTASGKAPVTLTVNGKRQNVSVDPRRTLLDMLRNDLDLTGSKKVCDRGTCGACTVLLDGRTVYSCMTLALDAAGKKVETIEGMASGDKLHPLQEEFIEHDALMCGFCTPGFLMSGKALLDKNKKPTLDDVKNACSGNLCRCGTYPRIFEAVLDAAKRS